MKGAAEKVRPNGKLNLVFADGKTCPITSVSFFAIIDSEKGKKRRANTDSRFGLEIATCRPPLSGLALRCLHFLPLFSAAIITFNGKNWEGNNSRFIVIIGTFIVIYFRDENT